MENIGSLYAPRQQYFTAADGWTPFHLAAERGYLPICQQIMENDIDNRIKKQKRNNNGENALNMDGRQPLVNRNSDNAYQFRRMIIH